MHGRVEKRPEKISPRAQKLCHEAVKVLYDEENYMKIALTESLWKKTYNLLLQAKQVSRDYMAVYNHLGNIHATYTSDYLVAVAYYKEALHYNPQSHAVIYNVGLLYERLQMYKFAMALYKYALIVNPTYAPAWGGLGRLYGKTPRVDFATARQALEKAIEYESGPRMRGVWRRLRLELEKKQ